MRNKTIMLFIIVFFLSITFPLTSTNIAKADQFGLKAIGECGFVQLSWNAVKGADSYWIYRGPGKGKEYSTPLTDFPIRATTFKDEINIENEQEYCYFVAAVDKSAKEISKSDEACATPKCIETRQEPSCKLVLKYQIDNTIYWVNEDSKGPMETAPIILNSRMFLVIRYVTSEIEGTKLEWVASEKKAQIMTRKGGTIELWIGKKDAKINGKLTQIDPNNPKVVPVIKDGRTLLPMRFVGENLGAAGADGIKWFESTKTVEIKVDDPECEKEGFRYPKATQLKGTLFEFSVEYHTSKSLFPEEVSLGLAKGDNSKILKLRKIKQGNILTDGLSPVETPEAKIEDIKSSFGKAKLYRFRLTLAPGVLHFYKFFAKKVPFPSEGYFGPVSTPVVNSFKLDDIDLRKIEAGRSMTIQGFFSSEPYPMIIDDYWKIFEMERRPAKKLLVRLEKGQTIENGSFVCLEGQTSITKGTPMLEIKKMVSVQNIVLDKVTVRDFGFKTPSLRQCPNKFAIIFAGVLDDAEIHDEDDNIHVYKRLRADFTGDALSSYKTSINLGLCKENIYVCFGRGDEEIDWISADDGDGNPFDFEWTDHACRRTMENDAQRWWRGPDSWRVKKGSVEAFEESCERIKEKINLLPSDVTPEVYIFIGTHGNTDLVGDYNNHILSYFTIIDYIKEYIANTVPLMHARSKVKLLLGTCHAGSIINDMESNFKSKGNDYLEVCASSKADELGYGIWPGNINESSYANAGGSFSIPFRISLNEQADANPGKETDWKIGFDYAMQNDIFVLGYDAEQDDGSIITIYTHPQYWHSREMSMFFAGPAFQDLSTVNPEIRASMLVIGTDMSNAQLDICNCSKQYESTRGYPKSTIKIVNNGFRTFKVDSITADESVISKNTTENVILFSKNEGNSCIKNLAYFDQTELKPGDSVTCYVCALYYELRAQPLDANGYMATEGGLPAFVQVPITIRYYNDPSDKMTLRTTLGLRVEGDGYEAKYMVKASRTSSIKKGFEMGWDPLDAEVTISPKPEGTSSDLLAYPNFKGDVNMNVKTDIFKKMRGQNTFYGYMKAIKIEIPMVKIAGLSCNEDYDWGWATIGEVTGKLKDKVTFIAPTYGNRKLKSVSLIITPGALSREGFLTFVGKHTFNINIYRHTKYLCTYDRRDEATINLKLTVELVDPSIINGG